MRSASQEREWQPGSGSNRGAATLDRFSVLPNYLSDLSLFSPLAHFRMQDLSSLTRDEAALPEVEVRGPHHWTTSPSVQFSRSVMSDSLQPHGLQHTGLPCPSPTPRACSNLCPSSQ